jgi:hypothetical protein
MILEAVKSTLKDLPVLKVAKCPGVPYQSLGSEHPLCFLFKVLYRRPAKGFTQLACAFELLLL